jgi:hypothetical protein
VEDCDQGLRLGVSSAVHWDYDSRAIRGSAIDCVAALLTVEHESQPFRRLNDIGRPNSGQLRVHAWTSTGLMRMSSDGIDSPWALRLSR